MRRFASLRSFNSLKSSGASRKTVINYFSLAYLLPRPKQRKSRSASYGSFCFLCVGRRTRRGSGSAVQCWLASIREVWGWILHSKIWKEPACSFISMRCPEAAQVGRTWRKEHKKLRLAFIYNIRIIKSVYQGGE